MIFWDDLEELLPALHSLKLSGTKLTGQLTKLMTLCAKEPVKATQLSRGKLTGPTAKLMNGSSGSCFQVNNRKNVLLKKLHLSDTPVEGHLGDLAHFQIKIIDKSNNQKKNFLKKEISRIIFLSNQLLNLQVFDRNQTTDANLMIRHAAPHAL